MIRIVVVDDHAVVRTGLTLLLEAEEDMQVIGDAGNARDAIFEVRAGKPDVILLDVVMPDESGIEVLPKLLNEAPAAKVLMLSMQDDPSYVREAFAAGASGYVLKEAADTEVVAAIREVAAGNRYVHPALGARMVAADAAAQEAAASDPLSEREREVLRLLALVTRTRRSPSSSTSRCEPPRLTVRTSCASSGSRPVPSSFATRSSTDS